MSGAAEAAVAMPPPGRPALASIQVMRGIATLAVVFYHAQLILAQPRYGGAEVWSWWASKGWIGVDFFVLSGFIIPYAHWPDIGRPERAGRYVFRRLSRVYPIYWVFLSIYIAAASTGLFQAEFSRDPLNILSAYLLVQLVPTPTLPLQVAWTLFFEMFFYGAFLLLILQKRLGAAVLGLWIAAVAIIGPVLGDGEPGWYLHSWNLYFVFGLGGYLLYRRMEGRDGVAILAAGLATLALMLAAGLVSNQISVTQRDPHALLALAFPFTAILLGAALADRRRGWRPPALLALLGDASYATYLVHSPAISALALVNAKLGGGRVPAEALFVAVAFVSVAAGVVAHLALERPLLAPNDPVRRNGEPTLAYLRYYPSAARVPVGYE